MTVTPVGAGEVALADRLDLALSDRGVNRKTCERSAVAGAAELPRVEDRVHVFVLPLAGGSTRLVDGVSFRRVAKRSDSDPRDALFDSEMLGEEARASTLGLSASDGDRVMLPVPLRLPIFGLEASDGCGNALVENEFDRSGPVLDSNLRKLGGGDWLAGGLKEGLDGAIWEGAVWNDLPEPKEGLEGREGADLGWVNEGLGWLKDGLGRLKEGLGDGLGRLNDGLGWLIEGPELPENDLCWKLDMRSAPPDLSRPSARPPTMGRNQRGRRHHCHCRSRSDYLILPHLAAPFVRRPPSRNTPHDT